jgi:quinol monooxygenase YgiN
MLSHSVYFSLKEPTEENKQKLVAACHEFLTGHPGEVFFAAGTCSNYDRSVNDRDYDVALQVVFVDHDAHDAYQTAPRHRQFVDGFQTLWAKVRVFDADVTIQSA